MTPDEFFGKDDKVNNGGNAEANDFDWNFDGQPAGKEEGNGDDFFNFDNNQKNDDDPLGLNSAPVQ